MLQTGVFQVSSLGDVVRPSWASSQGSEVRSWDKRGQKPLGATTCCGEPPPAPVSHFWLLLWQLRCVSPKMNSIMRS